MRDKRREELVEENMTLKNEVRKWKILTEELAIKYQEKLEENQLLKETIIELKHQLMKHVGHQPSGFAGKMGHH